MREVDHLPQFQQWVEQFDNERPTLAVIDTPGRCVRSIQEEVVEVSHSLTDFPTEEERHELAMELADVVMWTARLANTFGIDLIDSLRQKINLNQQLYPAERFQEGDGLETYHQIKREQGRDRQMTLGVDYTLMLQ